MDIENSTYWYKITAPQELVKGKQEISVSWNLGMRADFGG